jgi:hypothetical protein
MSNQNEDPLLSHDEDQPTSAGRVPSSRLTHEATSKIASEMHRWGRMTGVFSIILLAIWLPVDAFPSPSPEVRAIGSSLLWPGVVLAILAAVGLFGGFRFDYPAGRRR